MTEEQVLMPPVDQDDDFLAEIAPEEVGGEVVLDDPVAVDRLIQRINRLRQKGTELEAIARAEIRRWRDEVQQAQDWVDGKLKTIQSNIDFFSRPLEKSLELYIRDIHRKTEGKTKSVDLPHGKLQLRAQQDGVEVDEATVLGWADKQEQPPAFVKTVRKVSLSELKKHLKETGEVVEGVTIVPAGEPKFSVVTKEK